MGDTPLCNNFTSPPGLTACAPAVVVVAALIWRADRLMIQQRRLAGLYGGLWEFPGGKVEPGETDVQALQREAHEELGVTLQIGAMVYSTLWHDARAHVDLRFFTAHLQASAQPACLAAQQQLWGSVEQLARLPFCPGDKGVISALLTGRLRGPGVC